MGNALDRLRAYLHRHAKHAIVQTLEQGDEADLIQSEQSAHLQVVKIQGGEQVEQITALLPDADAC